MTESRQFKSWLLIGVESLSDRGGDLVLAASPLAFLDEAVGGNRPGLIIAFGFTSLKERKALVELCGYLRSNPLSRGEPLLCILHETHRRLVEQLAKSGVEWTVCLDREGLPLAEVLLNPERFQTAEYATSAVLDSLCPFLHYQPLDGRRELKVCGAYRDRMVLGRPTLEVYCHRPEHRSCPFYLAPRPPRRMDEPGPGRRRIA